jgi:hypothetical protein
MLSVKRVMIGKCMQSLTLCFKSTMNRFIRFLVLTFLLLISPW